MSLISVPQLTEDSTISFFSFVFSSSNVQRQAGSLVCPRSQLITKQYFRHLACLHDLCSSYVETSAHIRKHNTEKRVFIHYPSGIRTRDRSVREPFSRFSSWPMFIKRSAVAHVGFMHNISYLPGRLLLPATRGHSNESPLLRRGSGP
jgi:hypothetical protein